VAFAFKYGVINNSLNPFNGDAYYWNAVDGKLWLNTTTSFIQISTDPIKDFGIRGNATETTTEDGYAYWWGSNNSLMMNTPTLSAPTTSLEIDADIQGFGLRNDGYGFYWSADSGSHSLFLNTPSTNILITSDALGFGMRSDGNAYFWDATRGGALFLDSPSALYNISSVLISGFQSDGYCLDANAFNSSINSANYYIGGTGYFADAGTTKLYKNTTTIGAQLVLGTLASSAVNLQYRVSSSAPGLGGTVWVQTLFGNGAIVYEPLYGAPTVGNNGGLGSDLDSSVVKEYVIYWGSQWPSPSVGPSSSTLNSAIGAMLSSNYLKSLTQYSVTSFTDPGTISGNATLAGSWTDTTDSLGSTFSQTQIQNVVNNAINANGWPKTTDIFNAAIYMVITQPGSSFAGSSEANGFHSKFVDGFGNVDVYGWAQDSGSVASVLTPLSHETVESITDPSPLSGITETAAPAMNPLLNALGFTSTTDELADFEPNLLNYVATFVRGGVTFYVQAYWSSSLQAYIAES
jgi:hypothetical protein